MREVISMAHGAGGTTMQGLIKNRIIRFLGGSKAEVPLEALDDAAVIHDIALKSDSYTVKPIFFPGGNIGSLAVSGTINDLSVIGAEPIALALGFVFEEGFPLADLDTIMESIQSTCNLADVPVITGDTKVVERGALDRMIVNSSGIGVRSEALESNLREVRKHRSIETRWLLDSNIRPGDKIILSGSIGDHGIAVLSSREGYGFETRVKSDAQPLNKMTRKALEAGGVVAMKDPTRGGLSNLLNEWTDKSKVGILVQESDLVVHQGVQAACEMLGLDPLEVGNEGKAALAVVAGRAGEVLDALRATPEGSEASIIGEATDKFDVVAMETLVGGKRIIAAPAGDPVPRIC